MAIRTRDDRTWPVALGIGVTVGLAIAARYYLGTFAGSAIMPSALCRPGAAQVGSWSVGAAALLGLLFGFGHCLAMCGPLVLSYSLALTGSRGARMAAHLRYSLGRATTYAAIGLVAGLVGQGVAHTGRLLGVQGAFSVIAGVGLVTVGRFTLAGRGLEPTGRFGAFVAGVQRRFAAAVAARSTYRIGLVNGLLPCGMVTSGAALALSSGSPGFGALTMALFGLGTLPAMLLFGTSAGRLAALARGPFRLAGAWLLVGAGVWTLVRMT